MKHLLTFLTLLFLAGCGTSDTEKQDTIIPSEHNATDNMKSFSPEAKLYTANVYDALDDVINTVQDTLTENKEIADKEYIEDLKENIQDLEEDYAEFDSINDVPKEFSKNHEQLKIETKNAIDGINQLLQNDTDNGVQKLQAALMEYKRVGEKFGYPQNSWD